MDAVLKVEKISKRFPGVQALKDVSFDLYPGEVHILAGENGAGKSTLSKCILGVYQPDEGKIFLNGEQMSFRGPQDALNKGIAAVYQELTMVPWLNAAQNIFFNREPLLIPHSMVIDQRKMIKDARRLLESLGCDDIDVTVPVRELGLASQQMVEIAKALSMNPGVIIFDEPTATLSDREVDAFFDQIRLLKKKGVGMIYISHRMQEFPKIGDRVTVLRDGRHIATLPQAESSGEELVRLMVGRDISQVYRHSCHSREEEALRIDKLSDRAGKVKDCSLYLKRGEIVGIAGLVGSGRTELSRLIFGIDKIGSGKVVLHGQDVTGKRPPHLVRAGLGLLPEDRKNLGLALRAPVSWNILSVSLKKVFPHLFLNQKKNDDIAMEYVRQLNIATPDVRTKAVSLSGGNQQKVVLAKWLLANTDTIIFDEPTRGIDVGAKMEIYRLMDQLAEQGKSILMISSELPELFGMCDRIYVMHEGRLTGEVARKDFSNEAVGRYMFAADREVE